MKIWHFSDLHLKKEDLGKIGYLGAPPKADVAVILGDLGGDLEENLRWCATNIRPRMPVVYVPGNHDFVSKSLLKASADGRRFARTLGIHYLDQDTAVVGGVRFTGGTFWSDYGVDVNRDGLEGEANVRRNMEAALGKADYKRIFHDERTGERLRPWHTAAVHDQTKGFIRRTLATKFDGPTVVLTHYGALKDCAQPGFENSPTHPSYTSDQSAMIEAYKPAMWLHGHIHHFHETMVGETLVACNPLGYDHETPGFRRHYVHDLG